jgi:hypothetical protein
MIVLIGSTLDHSPKDATLQSNIQAHLKNTNHVGLPLAPLMYQVPEDKVVYAALDILARCDALVVSSQHAGNPVMDILTDTAYHQRIPVYVWEEDHTALSMPLKTEETSPVQVRAFMETIMRMYRTHLRKNADYSPANILGTGEVGIVTRLWDKTARLMNLTGIKFQYLLHEGVEPPSDPQNEAIDDTYEDLAVYAIIGTLYRRNAWGR